MFTNGVNMSEDTDMADCDGEKVVTMMDVLQEQQDFEEDANAVLGASDDKNCTYSKGYIKRQAIYACMTCCSGAKEDETKRAGVCLACSLSCHENHELIELYTKRNFRCDCGNPKFNSHPCQFNSNKTDINEDNKYNQNYSGLYCICHRPYPDPESKVQDEMIQCIICEDWLHTSHIDAVVPPNDQYSEMICKGCMEKKIFLQDYIGFAVTPQNPDVDVVGTNDVSISNGYTSDSVLETSKENEELNMSVEDVKIICKTKNINMKDNTNEENNMKDDTNDKTASVKITESRNITDNNKDEQFKMEFNSSQEFLQSQDSYTEKKTKDQNETQSPTRIDVQEVVNTSNSDSISTTQEVPEKTNLNNSEETIQKPNEMSLAITMENKNEVKGTDLVTKENLLDKDESDSKIEEKLLYEDDTSNHSLNTGDEDINTVKNSDKKSDEAIAANTETQPIDKLTDTLEFINSDQPEQKTISGSVKEDFKETQPEIPKLSSEAETFDPSASNLDSMDKANDNENKIETMQPTNITDENNITKEEAPKFNNVAEEDDNKSKDDLCKNKNITEENEKHEQSITQQEVNEEKVKDDSENKNNVPNETITDTNENKRKLSMDEEKDIVVTKKLKADKECVKSCLRPKEGKKHVKGATFWSTSFRQKLCTCNECLAMYKDLSVLFLIDPEDTVSAYEMLGKEKAEGSPSQYEKGLQALSSLDRIQQINALTEYNKMRDKLLDFLKSFKDRREIVKEEDIKGFFAGMKPKREPDGVYFCR